MLVGLVKSLKRFKLGNGSSSQCRCSDIWKPRLFADSAWTSVWHGIHRFVTQYGVFYLEALSPAQLNMLVFKPRHNVICVLKIPEPHKSDILDRTNEVMHVNSPCFLLLQSRLESLFDERSNANAVLVRWMLALHQVSSLWSSTC